MYSPGAMNNAANSIALPQGFWRDQIIREDGSTFDSGWHKNQIQNDYAKILTSFLFIPNTPTNAFQYIVIGQGDVTWNNTAPIQSPSHTTLWSEFYRKAITTTHTTYRDPQANFIAAGSPTNVIQIDITLDVGEGTGTHREWGIVGGNADQFANSGYLWNWVVTLPEYVKGAGDVLNRSVRFIFPIQ